MEQALKQPFFAKLALGLTCVLWASAFIIIRQTVTVYSPSDLAFLRYAVASVMMLFLYFARTRHNTVRLSDIPRMMGLGMVGIALYNITLNMGETRVSAATASFIISQVPILTTVLALIFLKEKITLKSVVGLLISFVGVLIIALNDITQWHTGTDMLYVVVAAVCGSIFSILQKPLLKRIDPFQFVAWAIWGATLVMLYWAPTTWQQLQTAPHLITAEVIFIGIFPAAIAYALCSYAMTYIPVSQAATYLYSIPLLVVIMSWIFLQSWPSVFNLLGGCIALLGLIIVNVGKNKTPCIGLKQE